MSKLERFQVAVGVVVSIATVVIGFQSVEISERTNANNVQLKAIEQQLAQSRFGFERIRDVYDRTEKYLASENQNISRGRVLVVLINSLPDSSLRAELLAVVTETAKSPTVAAKAADLQAGLSPGSAVSVEDPSFFGDLSLAFDSATYQVQTLGDFGFIDSDEASWTVPKGTLTSGSSIPRATWSVVGSPLDSAYTIPIVLHDYYSTLRSHSHQSVNKMFYEALLKVGVGQVKAKILYSAVVAYGPRWTVRDGKE